MKTATGCDAHATVLFGAFDRHNAGDLLLAHVVGRLLARPGIHYAGLATRDLTACGGHSVIALPRLAGMLGPMPVDIVHVGGEILTCGAWEAAVMLQSGEEAGAIIARLDDRPVERAAWAASCLGLADRAPYVLPEGLFRNVRRVDFHGIGGIDLDRRDPVMRAEVAGKLASATRVGVRDGQTLALLEKSGVACRLEPDPAVMVAHLFGPRIRHRARHGELVRTLSAFPHGYLAFQCSADFGDDDTLARLAAQLERFTTAHGLGVVMFRAGAAPWHDDPACYHRLASRMRGTLVALFGSLDLWDICAVIAHSRLHAGSSLHGSIVAGAFALPHVGLLRPGQSPQASKQVAFATTWGTAGAPAAVPVDALAEGMEAALASDPSERERLARDRVAAFRASFRLDRQR